MMREYHVSSLDEVSCGDHCVSQSPADEDCLLCAPMLFQQAAVTREEGRLGVMLQRTDNCYLKPELPHVQQGNEDLSLCSGF